MRAWSSPVSQPIPEIDHRPTAGQVELGKQSDDLGPSIAEGGPIPTSGSAVRRFGGAGRRLPGAEWKLRDANGRIVEQHGAGGFEERPTVALVGFEVVALGPFVPGQDEEVILLRADVGHRVDCRRSQCS